MISLMLTMLEKVRQCSLEIELIILTHRCVEEIVRSDADAEDTRTNDDVDQVDYIHSGTVPVVSRELTMLATPFVRNGWGVAELERTYDEDEKVIPAFREIGPDETAVGLSVIKYHDPSGGWRYLWSTPACMV